MARLTDAATPLTGPAADHKGVLLVLLATGFFSLGGILVRLTQGASGWQIIFYRALSLTAAMLVLLAFRYRHHIAEAIRSAGWNGVLAGTAASATLVSFVLALQEISVANTIFMTGLAPFIAALLGRVFLGERISAVTWAAMVLAVAGVVVMVADAVSFDELYGNVLALTYAVSLALMSFFLRRGRKSDMLPASLISGVIASALAFVVLVADDDKAGFGFAVSARDLGLCMMMGMVQLGGGLFCYTLGARHVPAAQLQLLGMVELVLSPLWVWLLLGHVPPQAVFLGGLLILSATVMQVVASGSVRRAAPATNV